MKCCKGMWLRKFRVRRRTEYKSWNGKVKELLKESKRRVYEEFGRKFSEKFNKKKKLFWKEVKREMEVLGWEYEKEERGWNSFK